ncbi:MAG TPA: serine/threonine-protein kinase [Kofleriaceae bacterium]|nr:serine/threonine-protein kinase [Kofleriaceae bacterium]
MRVCSSCERRTDESGRFCPECGAALIIEEASRSRAETEPPDAPQASPGSSSTATKLLGMTIDGQFGIESIIGGGAFGTVYRGRQVGLDRPVAVKVPTFEIAADPVMAKRFAREARAAARVQHPGVVGIYAVGELMDGRPYLAMQLVDGEPLDRALVDGPLPPARALGITRDIASALAETHAADVVHRDLKPSNVMWRRDRMGDDRITLVDFGIAVAKPGNADATRLTSNGLIGTPHYMSPEQAHGEVVDARADLYALGCLLFELVTGATPYEGSGFEVLLAHLGRPSPLPSSKNPDVPECIDKLCAALMQKKPDDRPANADTVVAMIDEALEQLPDGMRLSQLTVSRGAAGSSAKRPRKPARTMATRRDLPEGTVTPSRRRSMRLVLTAAVAIAALAGAGFAVRQLRDHPNTSATDPDEGGGSADNDPRIGRRRAIVKDSGDVIATAMVPDPLVHGFESRARLELKNKLGQPIKADELVLTIADPNGAAKGLTARPRGAADKRVPGRYYFAYTFAQAGRYTIRVFTPGSDSTLEIPLDVE